MAKHRTGHLFKRGDNFYLRWTIEGKVFSKALKDKSDNPITDKRKAEQAQTEFMAPLKVADEAAALESIATKLGGRKAELARIEDEKHPALLIAETWPAYIGALNRPDSGESTLRQYKFQWDQFADWMREKYPKLTALREVTPEVAEEYAGSLNHGRLTASTFNKHMRLLMLVFRVLKKKAKLGDNPWTKEFIQRKQLATQSRRELTKDELKKACDEAKGQLRVLFAIGIFSSLRLGDCCTLKKDEVDLDAGVSGIITRLPNKTKRKNPKPVVVPIHPTLRQMLREAMANSTNEYVLPEMAALYTKRIDLVTDLIQDHFENKCGIKLHKAGTGGKTGKRAVLLVGFHSLRHSFVSICRKAGVPLAVVESLVGHSNPAMTRHYTHIGELAAGNAINMLPALMGGDANGALQKTGPEILTEARTLAARLSAKNWKTMRKQLLALIPETLAS